VLRSQQDRHLTYVTTYFEVMSFIAHAPSLPDKGHERMKEACGNCILYRCVQYALKGPCWCLNCSLNVEFNNLCECEGNHVGRLGCIWSIVRTTW